MKLLNRLAKALGIDDKSFNEKRQFSVLSGALLANVGVVRAICDKHHREFLIAEMTVMAPSAEDLYIDAGGYCLTCQLYRCPECSIVTKVLSFEKPLWTIGCRECGLPYSSDLR